VSGDRDRRPSSSAGANRLCEHLSLSLNCCKLQLLLTSRHRSRQGAEMGRRSHAKTRKVDGKSHAKTLKWTERSHAKTPRRKGRRKTLTSADSLHFRGSPTDEHSVKIGQVSFFGSDSVGRGTLSNAIGLQRSSYLLPILSSSYLSVLASWREIFRPLWAVWREIFRPLGRLGVRADAVFFNICCLLQ
jgi:hypothetical protein